MYFDDTEKNSSAYGMLSSYGTSKGGEYVYSTEVVRIERGTDGRVSGVIAKGDSGSYTRYKAAKGVILATGGYNGDLDMVAKYIPWLDTNTTIEYSPSRPPATPAMVSRWPYGVVPASDQLPIAPWFTT